MVKLAFKPPEQGKQGPLRHDITPSRLNYKCLAKNCNRSIRGDKLSDHYAKNADMKMLELARKLSAIVQNFSPAPSKLET